MINSQLTGSSYGGELARLDGRCFKFMSLEKDWLIK